MDSTVSTTISGLFPTVLDALVAFIGAIFVPVVGLILLGIGVAIAYRILKYVAHRLGGS